MITICFNCKGNGFIKTKDEEDGEIKHEDSDSYWNYNPAK